MDYEKKYKELNGMIQEYLKARGDKRFYEVLLDHNYSSRHLIHFVWNNNKEHFSKLIKTEKDFKLLDEKYGLKKELLEEFIEEGRFIDLIKQKDLGPSSIIKLLKKYECFEDYKNSKHPEVIKYIFKHSDVISEKEAFFSNNSALHQCLLLKNKRYAAAMKSYFLDDRNIRALLSYIQYDFYACPEVTDMRAAKLHAMRFIKEHLGKTIEQIKEDSYLPIQRSYKGYIFVKTKNKKEDPYKTGVYIAALTPGTLFAKSMNTGTYFKVEDKHLKVLKEIAASDSFGWSENYKYLYEERKMYQFAAKKIEEAFQNGECIHAIRMKL